MKSFSGAMKKPGMRELGPQRQPQLGKTKLQSGISQIAFKCQIFTSHMIHQKKFLMLLHIVEFSIENSLVRND